jgi:hypothetical protein
MDAGLMNKDGYPSEGLPPQGVQAMPMQQMGQVQAMPMQQVGQPGIYANQPQMIAPVLVVGQPGQTVDW